jgi:hypothetical protein
MLVPVNGRRIFFNRVEGVRKVGTGKFEITASHGLHYAQGGRAAGGYHTEWYVEGPHWTGSIPCKSLVAAMRLVDGV